MPDYKQQLIQSSHSFLRDWQFVILKHFGHPLAWLTMRNKYDIPICSFHWCLTVCNKSKRSLISFRRYWYFVILEHFGHVLTCLITTQQKWHKQLVASTNIWLNAKNQVNHSIFSRNNNNLLFYSTLGMPEHRW